MQTRLTGALSALAALEQLAIDGLTPQQFLEEAVARLDRVVPSDGLFIGATDPTTSLCLGPGIVRDLPGDQCRPHWEYEFLVPDFMKFAEIARGAKATADLHEATGGRPERSPRWREFSAATGFRSELRAAFTSGGAAWGVAQLDRLGDSPRFSAIERAWLEAAAPIIGNGLRRALVAEATPATGGRGPGVVVLDADDAVVSGTAEAQAWLADIDPWFESHDSGPWAIPCHVHAYTGQVRAALHDPGPNPIPPARLRTRTGAWLLFHASPLGGSSDHLAVVVEPAKAADVTPLIVGAYGLTPRELDVTRAIGRGLGTAEIAAELVLSPHTVRDYVKAIFEKVAVSSRGELVAKVFADHYEAPSKHLQAA